MGTMARMSRMAQAGMMGQVSRIAQAGMMVRAVRLLWMEMGMETAARLEMMGKLQRSFTIISWRRRWRFWMR